jgi:hypothetical protein
MHMEGTRHEKIVLVLVSYVIGFITAFIAFGMKGEATAVVVSTNNTSTELVQNATPQNEQDLRITDVGFGSDGLFVMTDMYERIVSADKNALSANVISTSEDIPGFYYSIIDAEASRDGKFAYFCEQRVADAESCYPYVYSIDDDTVHAVSVDGQVYTSPIASHESSWSEDGSLILNSLASSDSQYPWILTLEVQ